MIMLENKGGSAMQLTPQTKVAALLEEYPFLLDFLVELNPHFNKLKNPVLRKAMAKVASLETAAGIAGMPVQEFIAKLEERVAQEAAGGAAPPPEAGADGAARQEALKGIIRDLHHGADVTQLKERFREIIQGVDAAEIARMEQQLMDEGLPAEEVKRLCDVHVELFKEALEERERPEPPAGHPVHTFMKENRRCEEIISSLALVLGMLGQPPQAERFQRHRQELTVLMDMLGEVELHYQRKENQLFPMLEAHHFTGPSQVMWAIHDDIRAGLKKARTALDSQDLPALTESLDAAAKAIREMIYKEEHILFPTSLEMLSDDEWRQVKDGEADIGFAWVTPDQGWPEETAPAPAPEPAPAEMGGTVEGALKLDTGALTLEQINLMLKHLPVDITFVDKNDRVAYYSEGPERIFPRSPAIIGREVRNCHPPKSVHKVNRILDEFKAGRKDTAWFWITLGGRFLLIRYWAVRDDQGYYKGCLEVSQDLTELRALEGEQRLLDWEA
jgi:DUF438 domain-containing protein